MAKLKSVRGLQEMTKVGRRSNTLRRPEGDKDCDLTELWRISPRVSAEGAKRLAANLSGKRTKCIHFIFV